MRAFVIDTNVLKNTFTYSIYLAEIAGSLSVEPSNHIRWHKSTKLHDSRTTVTHTHSKHNAIQYTDGY
jgi:hypothetical protein